MKLSRFFILCGFTALVGITTQLQATNAEEKSPYSAPALQQDSPKDPVIMLYRTLNSIQQSNSSNLTQHAAELKKTLKSAYDFPTILSNTTGYRYAAFTQEEKDQLLATFEDYTVARYIYSFENDKNTTFQILPDVKPSPVGNDEIVATKIGSASDPSSLTEVNYLVRKTPQGWKIVDVLLNGHISQVAVQNGDFNAPLNKGGVQELITMLKNKDNTSSTKK